MGARELTAMKMAHLKWLVVFLPVFTGCTQSPDFQAITLASSSTTFTSVYTSILVPKCMSCHSATLADGGVSVATYDDVMASPGAVVPFQPYQSQLFRQCYLKFMPRRMTALTNSELKQIYDWIANGAPNN